MLVVDAQVHIWRAATPEGSWPPGTRPHRAEALGVQELLQQMKAAGVDRVVLVPPRVERDRNDLSLEAARQYPERFAVMGRLNVKDPQAATQLVDWREQPGMLGLRFTLKRALESLLTEGTMDAIWPEAEKARLPIYVAVTQERASLIGDIASRYPGLRLVLDHLAIESDKQKDEEAFRNLDLVLALAKLPNVAVKATAMPCYSTDRYPYRNLHPYLRRVYDAFGPRRMFWGSDLSRLHGSYRECVTMFTEEMPWLSHDDLEWIMGRGLCEWLQWEM